MPLVVDLEGPHCYDLVLAFPIGSMLSAMGVVVVALVAKSLPVARVRMVLLEWFLVAGAAAAWAVPPISPAWSVTAILIAIAATIDTIRVARHRSEPHRGAP